MGIVKITLVMTLMMILVSLSMLVGLNVAWNNNPTPEQPPLVENVPEDKPEVEKPEENQPEVEQPGENENENENEEENEEENQVVTRPTNVILSNNADVTIAYLGADGQPTVMDQDTLFFGSDIAWADGHAEVVYVALVNNGETKASYSLSLRVNEEKGDASVKLSEVLQYGFIVNDMFDDASSAVGALESTAPVSSNYTKIGSIEPGDVVGLAIVVYLPEGADALLGDSEQSLSLGLSMFFTAPKAPENPTPEKPDVDEETVVAPTYPEFSSGAVEAPAVDTTGTTTEPIIIGGGESEISAVIPEGVKLEEGVTEMALDIKPVETPHEDVPVSKNETVMAIDVHVEGVAEDNDVPMLITLSKLFSKGLNSTSVKMYHVENGTPVEMTQVSNPVNHNEFYYDPSTGNVVMSVASFSEYVAITDDFNLWKGGFDYGWYNPNATEFTITTADQLAGFGVIVDGGYYTKNEAGERVWVPSDYSDTFEGKIVKLGADIDLSGGYSLNPIGCGYVNGTNNSGGLGVNGRSFMGTFDGQNHTIRYLYQNGWDLGLEYCNLGGGLFASVCNATIKNLNMVDAEIVMECVEQGVIAGLAQGNCIFENIAISNCSVANYQRATGGVVGEVSQGIGEAKEFTHTFKNIRIDNKTVVGSLWGDFDAPVGGVIGGYWDDSNRTKVIMENVEVACRLDVYNDVTSSYQWYAYRRAGMLVGNTDHADGHTATAPFLTCSNVKVYYGDWVDYHYCEFSESYNSPSWPFVRVEAGENCNAYSNPRWGVAKDANGKAITDAHTQNDHSSDDECRILLPFGQLYGGGQGVYGGGQTDDYVSTHAGVTIVKYVYTITYINDYKVLYVDYVDEERAATGVTVGNKSANQLVIEWAEKNIGVKDIDFVFNNNWMNAGSTPISKIEAGNDKDITLYPHFNKPYTARFVDQKGNVLSWCLFHDGTDGLNSLKSALDSATSHLPDPGKDFELDYWEVNANGSKVAYKESNFKSYTYDVTIYPVYKYTGNLRLTPIDNENDGIIDYYQVDAIKALDETTTIPGYVNGIPVKVVNKLYENDNSWDFGSGVKTVIIEEGVEELVRNSLGYTNDLTTVELPSTLTKLGKNTFSRNLWYNIIGDKDTKVLNIVYNGTKDDWDKVVANSDGEWANGLKKGTTVKCTDGTYTVTSVNIETSNQKWSWTPNS